MTYVNRHQTPTIVEQRWVEAFDLARELGMSEEDATKVADRARREAHAGVQNDTASFAGKAAISFHKNGTKGIRIQSYTGHYVDPLGTGIENASTLD